MDGVDVGDVGTVSVVGAVGEGGLTMEVVDVVVGDVVVVGTGEVGCVVDGRVVGDVGSTGGTVVSGVVGCVDGGTTAVVGADEMDVAEDEVVGVTAGALVSGTVGFAVGDGTTSFVLPATTTMCGVTAWGTTEVVVSSDPGADVSRDCVDVEELGACVAPVVGDVGVPDGWYEEATCGCGRAESCPT